MTLFFFLKPDPREWSKICSSSPCSLACATRCAMLGTGLFDGVVGTRTGAILTSRSGITTARLASRSHYYTYTRYLYEHPWSTLKECNTMNDALVKTSTFRVASF